MSADPTNDVDSRPKLFRRIELRASIEKRHAIYNSALDSSSIDIEYAALLILAGLIALFGLLENSAAVIIGAMLISPLMNPVLSAALALLLGDGSLGKRSATVLGLSIAGVIGVTWFVASLTPLKEATPEILARTAPNLLDLFIAFLSGLAGTLALRGGSVAMTILPGVAIAVAVVPPLSVVGYGLSTRQWSIAGGAFLLFVTNLVAIVISAAGVYRVMGFRPRREAEKGRWKMKYRMGVSAIVLLLLSIPLFLTLRKAAIQVALRAEVHRELQKSFNSDRASISDFDFSQLAKGLSIQATLRTTQYVDTEQIRSVEKALQNRFGPDSKLLIDQILVTQGGVAAAPKTAAQNPILGGVVKPVEVSAPPDIKGSNEKNLDLIQSDLDGILAGTGVRQEAAPEITYSSSGPLVLTLKLSSDEPIDAQTISLLASQLGIKLGLAVQLHGQVELLGKPFQLTLAPPNPDARLSADDRAALNRLIKQLQAEENLLLQVTYGSGQTAQVGKELPRFVSEIQSILSRSGLKTGQWAIGAGGSLATNSAPAGASAAPPAAGIAATSSTATASAPFRSDLKIFQNF